MDCERLRSVDAGTFKHCDMLLVKGTWLDNTWGSASQDESAQSNFLHTVEGDKVPVMHMKKKRKNVWCVPQEDLTANNLNCMMLIDI